MAGRLLHSPANVCRYLVVSLGGGTLPTDKGAWPIFWSNEAPTPDDAITFYDYQGRQQGRDMNSGEMQEHHGVQIRVRGQDPESGYAKARAIVQIIDTLVKRNTITITTSVGTGTYRVDAITRTTDVIPLGKESPTSKRSLFTINALVALRQTA